MTRSTELTSNQSPRNWELCLRCHHAQPPERTTPPTVPTRLDRHQWHKTQHPTIPSISHGPKGFIRVKTKRQSIACSPRTLKSASGGAIFCKSEDPPKNLVLGCYLMRRAFQTHSSPIQSSCMAIGWIVVWSIEPIFCSMSRIRHFHAENSAKRTHGAQNAVFGADHA